jgi:hypothetical protein
MRAFFLTLLLGLCSATYGAATYGSDFVTTTSGNADSLTQTATLGSTGANSILFVLIEAESAYSTPSVDYNGVALTAIGTASVLYTGTQTISKGLFYLQGTLTSGQNIHVFSGSPTTLSQGGSKIWHIRYWSYGGVSGVGTSSVDATQFATSASGSPVAVAFNFTPSASTSTILQLMPGQGSSCPINYTVANGTVRQAILTGTIGGTAPWFAMGDYAPGSTSTLSLSQSFTPNFCTSTGYAWGVEMLASGSSGGGNPPNNSLMMMGVGD